MGDVGSSFAGFFIGLMALFTVQAGVMTYWTWLILLATFAVDATLTLACRSGAVSIGLKGTILMLTNMPPENSRATVKLR